MANSVPRSAARPLVHLLLLIATVFTTYFAYRAFHSQGGGAWEPLAFSLTVIAILGSHEMGHYVAARLHGVDTTLPYFIPIPLGFGTLGAVIRIRSRIPTRNALLDIGAAGPLTGLVVAIPLLYFGLRMSTLQPGTPLPPTHLPEPFSVIALVPRMVAWVTETAQGTWHPSPYVYTLGEPLLLRGLEYLALGSIPNGTDIVPHPMVLAGWFGLLVTTLNLCPIGQLDGGHVAYAVLGHRARLVGQIASAGLAFLTLFVSINWLLWWLLTWKVIGFGHPPVTYAEEPLTRGRKVVAALCFIALVVSLVPAPFQVYFQ